MSAINTYYPHIRLDDEEQELDVHERTPSQRQDGSWGLIYWGRDIARVVMSEACYPEIKENYLLFPAEMLPFYP